MRSQKVGHDLVTEQQNPHNGFMIRKVDLFCIKASGGRVALKSTRRLGRVSRDPGSLHFPHLSTSPPCMIGLSKTKAHRGFLAKGITRRVHTYYHPKDTAHSV